MASSFLAPVTFSSGVFGRRTRGEGELRRERLWRLCGGKKASKNTARCGRWTAAADDEALTKASDVAPETPETKKFLDGLKYDKNGLVVAIAQDVDTGAIYFDNAD